MRAGAFGLGGTPTAVLRKQCKNSIPRLPGRVRRAAPPDRRRRRVPDHGAASRAAPSSRAAVRARIGTIKKVAARRGRHSRISPSSRLVAEYWGCGEMFRAWQSPAATFQILERLSAGQPCDLTGIDDCDVLHERGGIQGRARRGVGNRRTYRTAPLRGRPLLPPPGRARPFSCTKIRARCRSRRTTGFRCPPDRPRQRAA